jgi:carboxyl-terminal processing protease
MRKTSLVVLGAAFGIVLTLFTTRPSLIWEASDAKAASADYYRRLELFADVFSQVRTRHLEQPDDRKLIESAINGMLSGLENSSYVDIAHADAMSCVLDCGGPGVGVDVTMADGLAEVITPIDNTAAATAHILSGDVIADINGESLQGLTLDQVRERLAGADHDTIRLKVVHPGQRRSVTVSLASGIVAAPPVRRHVEGDVGYLRIPEFTNQTADEVTLAIDEIRAKIPPDALKGFVLDLRNNPGGSFDAAVAVADAFLDDGDIVSIRGRDPNDSQRFSAKPGDLIAGKPIVVLMNGGSASTAEVLAGALQDHKRAAVIGSRSFGEGSVQTVFNLGQGNGAIRLTTGHYVTPAGHVIESKGLKPDIEVLQNLPDELKPDPNVKDNARTALQSYIPPDAKDDKALTAAYDLLHGPDAHAALPAPSNDHVPN